MRLTDTRWTVDTPQETDLPEIARLLIELYRAEAPQSLPADENAFASLLQIGLRGQCPSVLETSLVVRDLEDSGHLAGYVALSPDSRPRRPLFVHPNFLSGATRLLGVRAAMKVLVHQYRMMGLLCSPLVTGAGQLHSLVVDRDHRGKGLAVQLVSALEDLAVRHDQESIVLFVFDGNPVEQFYRRLGYMPVPLPQPRFPLPQRGIAMQRPLHPAA
jgi:ribosomal protein S18 acetylase RimI-like enzyme